VSRHGGSPLALRRRFWRCLWVMGLCKLSMAQFVKTAGQTTSPLPQIGHGVTHWTPRQPSSTRPTRIYVGHPAPLFGHLAAIGRFGTTRHHGRPPPCCSRRKAAAWSSLTDWEDIYQATIMNSQRMRTYVYQTTDFQANGWDTTLYHTTYSQAIILNSQRMGLHYFLLDDRFPSNHPEQPTDETLL
jgi:hypothetical protein